MGVQGIESTFAAFLAATERDTSDRLLETLLTGDLDRIIRGVISHTLASTVRSGGAVFEDLEDVRSEVRLLLIRKLYQHKATLCQEGIADLPAYVATVARHACFACLRRRRPVWMRLRNQVRYLAAHDPELSLLEEHDRLVCVMRRSGPGGEEMDLQRLPLRELARVLVARSGGRLALDELVAAIGDIRGVRDADSAVSTPGNEIERFPDPRAPVSVTLDQAAYLQRVWAEVGQLPLRQRWALLLNLRSPSGEGLLGLLPLTGTATLRQIAEALELPAQEFARMWRGLPMDDLSIASRLGVSRQQVINLRKSARERLSRRLAGNIAPRSDFFVLGQDRSVHRAP